ncbi:MAG: hypothetical protein AUG74_08580 [Bacteroidetes bacterium 13_1_20CM_4_60_6]|nr:MAG: hypothetical protein AUG74_08580 [Bacteroidetes bacterium 13_1_20CM_4_60_6]
MKRGHALLALALAAAPAAAPAQTIDRSNGEAGAPILQLTTTPRAAALGGALAAASGVTSIFANPAGAVTVGRFEAQLAGQTLFEGSKAGSMALGVRRHAVGLALGIRYLDLGSVDEVVCNGCGGRGGGAASFSAGVRGRLSSKLAVGASVQYLGGQVNVGGFGAPLPRTVRAGAELRPLGAGHERVHLLLAADYSAVRGAPGRLGGGIEAGLADPATQLLAVARLGYLSRAGGDFDSRPVTLGLGLRFHQLSLDYAYQGAEVLSSQHRLGLTYFVP